MGYKEILAAIGIVIGFVSYTSYFRGIFSGQTKPHIFSWFIWAVINSTAFAAQLVKGGGAGAWITGVNALLCWMVAALALRHGEKEIAILDWISLAGAIGGIISWALTHNPLTAVVLVCLTDYCAIIPTFRKSFKKPYEENAFAFGIDELKFVLELIALQSFNLTTALYPVAVLVNDTALVVMILIRRKQLAKT